MFSYTFKMTVTTIICLCLLVLCLINPTSSLNGAISGIMLCGNVIIPSLFPFCAIALFAFKSGVTGFLSRLLDGVSRKLFHQSGEQFCVFLMSFLAGYPVGIRLINELAEQKKITSEQAKRMGLYCVNAGPAFILVAVGEGILHDRALGIILFLGNLIATVLLAIITEFSSKPPIYVKNELEANIGDSFVESVAQAATSVFGICAWVILFSALLSALKCKFIPNFIYAPISYACEVTNGVIFARRNLLMVAAILSFGGFSVHCQFYSIGKKNAPPYLKFLLFRAFHAALSAAFVYLLLMLSGKTVTTFSNGVEPIRQNISFTVAGAISLMLMSIFLISSTQYEKKK